MDFFYEIKLGGGFCKGGGFKGSEKIEENEKKNK